MIYSANAKTQLYGELHDQGFDRTTVIEAGPQLRVRCSQCEALVINGVPAHETGCPNQTFECRGCNNRVARGVRYCGDCQ